ncbi:hypothetical protein LCGC14_0830250 [marine sediment metagenome]|uniref:LamG-like jellyroll fold domain-containing protein n=1 Tax=marine sediment metagenome TaxID=412755 RepID=A0A0F9Q1G9_9ZZZZ
MVMVSSLQCKSLWSYNPIPRGCVVYAPLWNPACHGPVFSSIDPFHLTITRTGGVMDGDGFTVDGDDYMHFTSPLAAGSTFTVNVWFKQTTRQDTRLIALNLNDGGQQGICIGIDAGNNYLRVVYDGVAWGDGTFVPTLGSWYMATLVRVADVSNLYLNAGAGVISTIDNTPQDSGTEIHIGKGTAPGVADFFLKGGISEVGIYNRALSAVERDYLFAKTYRQTYR